MDDALQLTLDVQMEVEVATEDALPEPPPVKNCILADSIQQNMDCVSVLESDPSYLRTIVVCLLAAKATGTVKAYKCVILAFQRFCETKNVPFPDFPSEVLLEFILLRVKDGATFGALANIKPAICYLTTALGRPSPFSPFMDLILSGAKRRSREDAPPVQKAAALPTDALRTVLDKFVLPFVHNIAAAKPAHLRTAFRLLIEYHTLCRLSCFRQLQGRHFERVGPDIAITFPKAKNDQLHEGRTSFLVATDSPYCPVRLAQLYFRCFGIRFGAAAGDASYVNFQLRRQAARTVPILHKSLGYTTATEDLRSLFKAAGLSTTRISDKSVKMAGVTAAFEAGATTEDVMHAGRWRTPSIPLHYKHNSAAFKRTVAAKIPALAAPAAALAAVLATAAAPAAAPPPATAATPPAAIHSA